jgi:hypothetical protein
VSQQRLASLFGDAQSEGSDEHAAQLNTTALEMAFDEFLETLAAMAIFVQPDPYLSLAHRLGNFLAADLLPALQVRSVRAGVVVWAQRMRGRIHTVLVFVCVLRSDAIPVRCSCMWRATAILLLFKCIELTWYLCSFLYLRLHLHLYLYLHLLPLPLLTIASHHQDKVKNLRRASILGPKDAAAAVEQRAAAALEAKRAGTVAALVGIPAPAP